MRVSLENEIEGGLELVSGSNSALVYILDATLKQLAGSSGWLINGSHIQAFGASEAQFRASGNKIYSSGVNLLDILAATRLNLGAAGDAEFGNGSAAIALVPTSGSTMDVGTSTKPARDIYADGVMGIQAGNASGTFARIGGTIYVDVTDRPNPALAGDQDLASYSIPANTLSSDKQRIEFEAAGITANNANTKTIKIKFGAAPATLVTVATTVAQKDWAIRGSIYRVDATNQRCQTYGAFDGVSPISDDYVAATETLSNALTLKVTASSSASAASDVTQKFFRVSWQDGV